MLEENGVEYRYREYTKEPLSAAEIREVLGKLGVKPREVLRKNDKAYKEAAISGEESDAQLITLMAKFPTLLQRPIGVVGDRAILGRPAENLAELF